MRLMLLQHTVDMLSPTQVGARSQHHTRSEMEYSVQTSSITFTFTSVTSQKSEEDHSIHP